MEREFFQCMNRLSRLLSYFASTRFALFGFTKNRASYSSRSPLMHSYGYASAADRTDYLARFRLRSESFVNYPG